MMMLIYKYHPTTTQGLGLITLIHVTFLNLVSLQDPEVVTGLASVVQMSTSRNTGSMNNQGIMMYLNQHKDNLVTVLRHVTVQHSRVIFVGTQLTEAGEFCGEKLNIIVLSVKQIFV